MRTSARLRVLVIDDDPVERERCARFLEADRRVRYVILEAADAASARRLVEDDPPDCVLLDHSLPDVDGIAFVGELADARGRVGLPVVMMTAESDAALAVASIKAGAQDYAVKSRLTAEGLSRSIRNAIEKVTLRHQLEAKQAALDASLRRELEMKEELLSHVSHELRTPLTAVHQFVSILLDGVAGELNPQQKEYLSIVHKNARQLRDMIGDLMDVARGGAGKLGVEPAILPLAPVLEDAVRSLQETASARKVALALEPADPMPDVLADELRLRQVLANLLTNAIKFSAPGTRVWVRAAPEPARDGQPRDLMRISVVDQGCGIAPESLERIFLRMHQEPGHAPSSRRGLGLGLYICKQLVVAHGGQIWAESTPGEGSRFHFTLPIYSLSRVLEPLVSLVGESGSGCQLLAVDSVLPDAESADEVEEAHAALHREVAALVHYNRDVVIPRLRARRRSPGPPRDICFVVADADEHTVRPMVSRLLRALRRSALVGSLGAEIAIRCHPLPLEPRASVDDSVWLERWVRGVRRAIAAELRTSGLETS